MRLRLYAGLGIVAAGTAAPSVPPEQAAIQRRAFDAAMKDPDLLTEAAKLNLEIDILTGQQVQDVVSDVLDTPKPVMNQIKKVLGLPVE